MYRLSRILLKETLKPSSRVLKGRPSSEIHIASFNLTTVCSGQALSKNLCTETPFDAAKNESDYASNPLTLSLQSAGDADAVLQCVNSNSFRVREACEALIVLGNMRNTDLKGRHFLHQQTLPLRENENIWFIIIVIIIIIIAEIAWSWSWC